MAPSNETGSFQYSALSRVLYGAEATQALPAEVDRLGGMRVLLVFSRSLDKETDEIKKLIAALGPRLVARIDGVPPHTPRDFVVEAARLAREAAIDLVCTVGGGSVTEAGKGIRTCLEHDIRSIDQLDGMHLRGLPDGTIHNPMTRGPTIPQIAVPTTLSGGEFNSSGTMTHPVTRVKQAFAHHDVTPRVVILDPAIARHTPLDLWLSTGIRALDHAVEALLAASIDPMSEAASLHAAKLLAESLRQTRQNPDDLSARNRSQCGVWLACTPVAAGVPLGASHAIGRALGGTCGVPHGFTSCILLPAVLRYNAVVTAERQQVVATALGRPGAPASDAVGDLIRDLGLPRTLADAGVSRNDFEKIAENAMLDRGIYGNPRPIRGPADVLEILELAA